ncbi:glycine cleavage system protein GcvH [Paenibacillus doosanensis]|uniref:Glycine cleavage system H protein n=1 Tax=Paenibacillus konkukensis TaxID=2020716 RepID=A0ABY4RKS8_9BACL|nr:MULTISPECIES: glycine cleavage system protein GcvH [Paenibacillus]MCS7464579.1 glycine cleavage system protein GcvH [Paenibacillus doosanensis]UQZ82234.1 Glycine cleavage system H protein [Paenibacillus konkukensis]
MSEVRADLVYTGEHEWVRKTGAATVKIGITDFAQRQLGDIVFVELPAAGEEIEADQAIGTIESVKTVSDLFSPVNGKVLSVNEALLDSPELVNREPYDAGWIVEVEVGGALDEALAGLLAPERYEAYIADGD